MDSRRPVLHPSMLNKSSSSPVNTGPLSGLKGPWVGHPRPLALRTIPGATLPEGTGAAVAVLLLFSARDAAVEYDTCEIPIFQSWHFI